MKSETWPASAVSSLAIVNGPYFIGAAVLIDKTPSQMEVSGRYDSSSLSLVMDTVLLTAEFIGGKINLFSLIDQNKSHFFIQKPGGLITELYDRKYRLQEDGGLMEMEDKSYIHQLGKWMEDCPDLANNLLEVTYTGEALKKVVRNYNSCGRKEKTLYESDVRKEKVQIAVLAGVGFSGFNVNTSAGGLGKLTNPVKSNAAFAGGVSFDYFLSQTNKKFSLVGSILYNHTEGSESQYIFGPASSTDYTLQTLTIDYTSLHADLLWRYTIPLRGSLRPFIDAGLTFFGAISHKNTVATDEYYDNAHHVSYGDPFQGSFKGFQAGPEGGAGLSYRRFGLEYKFELIANISGTTYASTRVISQQLVLFFNLKN